MTGIEGKVVAITGASAGSARISKIGPGSLRDDGIGGWAEDCAHDVGIPPEAVARAIAFAVEQPDDVEIGDIAIRPTVQG